MNQIILMDKLVAVDERPELHPVDIYLQSLQSLLSRKTMKRCLTTMARIMLADDSVTAYDLPWHELRVTETAMLHEVLHRTYKASTANNHLSALRGVLQTYWRLGYISTEQHQRAVDFKNIKAEQVPAGRSIKPEEIRALFMECLDDGLIGYRDGAVIAVLYACGLRRAELSRLQLTDFNPEDAILLVHGKGNKQREVDVTNQTLMLLETWLMMRGNEPGYLFPKMGKGSRLYPAKRFQEPAIYDMIQRRARKAGIEDISPHDFRRTLVSNLLDSGADIAIVSRIVGHSSTDTTKRYDRRPAAARKKAMSKIDLPI